MLTALRVPRRAVARARMMSSQWEKPFPSILISKDVVSAQGSFAEAQANYLKPNMDAVKELDALLEKKKLGIVAHFYMDPELQGVLSSLKWPHTLIADSLAMGEAAAVMAKNGAKAVACLGVDFMSESVRANLDSNGYHDVPVYRLSKKKIGCSLAESAEKAAYMAYLTKAAETPNSLHVVYINTSLKSKAWAHNIIPTITCTSSNVVQTILQADAQVPGLNIWYGPDTYMGENLEQMFRHLVTLPDDKIAQIHPKHTQKTIASLLERFDYFKEGNCVVHHMFGDKVTQRVRDEYGDVYQTAHFEVPGEMFTLAMEAQNKGRGVVGSTSNILNFIKDKTKEAIAAKSSERLRFVLGTEAGMITSIVRGVQQTLRADGAATTPEVEIIFPVSADAVATEDNELVPGVQGGEGCSSAGGCATCPFMKMNDLDALFDVAEGVDLAAAADPLAAYHPQTYSERINGKTISEIGVAPILHMRAFMQGQALSAELVEDIATRTPGAGCPQARK
ncbi:quinolinate synthetase A protein [Achlya hypogyna]|uniref:Quinolinate synthase, chloroplastic n=1 Tax=Achlya hypogyna TaxID=1202772 RepID=A0A1V9ZAB1_ACHHY|nr:quinolinate synthetase A protein [Achlya hypogyna]